VQELVQAFIKVGNTAMEHRVGPTIFNLVNMPAVWDKLQDELAKEGKKTAVWHYQDLCLIWHLSLVFIKALTLYHLLFHPVYK
jgi:hypothetical protein